jgi:hypothetical protein
MTPFVAMHLRQPHNAMVITREAPSGCAIGMSIAVVSMHRWMPRLICKPLNWRIQ